MSSRSRNLRRRERVAEVKGKGRREKGRLVRIKGEGVFLIRNLDGSLEQNVKLKGKLERITLVFGPRKRCFIPVLEPREP